MSRKLNNRLRRQRAKRQAAFLVMGTTGFVLVVFLVFAFTPSSPARREEARVESEMLEAGVQANESGERDDGAGPLVLGLGGDVSFSLDAEAIVAAQGPAYPWEEIAPLLAECDLNLVNLESSLCRGEEPNPDQTTVLLRGDISCGAAMAEAGVDAVSLANDHAMDYCSSGLQETLNNLHGQDIETSGAGSSLDDAARPLLMETEDGGRVAVVSFCDVAPPSYGATGGSPGISVASPERIREAVQAASECPHVVAYFHWGELGSPYITERQRELAHAAVAAGADLVVGSHPHVLQGVEVWRGVPILYSLGNLVYAASSKERWSGAYAICRMDGGRLVEVEIVPLRLDGARPAPLSGDEALAALEELASRSPGADVVISPSEGRAHIRP